MKIQILSAVALAATVLISAPSSAQRSVAVPGNYSDVTDVKILPGHFEEYMDYLKTKWIKQQEWAKSKGYITGYKVYLNAYPRESEPTLYLLTEYKTVPSAAEIERRADEYAAMMKMDEHQQDADAMTRGPIRTIGSQAMLQEISFK